MNTAEPDCPDVPDPSQPTDAFTRPTRVRQTLLGFASTLAMITYVIVSGLAMPHLARVVRSTALARQLMALLGFAGAAVLLVVSYYLKDPLLAMLAMGSASFCNDLTMPGSWSTCMDVGGDYAGTLSGSMNMMGSVGAAVAPLVIGIILDCSNRNWALIFWISGSIYFLGGLCWLWIDPTTPLETNEDQQRFGDVEHVMDEVFVVLVDGAGKIHHVATPRI